MRVAAKPELFDAEQEHPQLRATRCRACGRIAAPPMTIGCDVCGAGPEQLAAISVAASGSIHAAATVHRHRGDLPTPFTVLEVQLDDGPVIRAMGDGEGLTNGAPVTARWQMTGTDDDGNDIVEPVFFADQANPAGNGPPASDGQAASAPQATNDRAES